MPTVRKHPGDIDPPDPEVPDRPKRAAGTGRLVAVDLVHALALYGMFVIITGAQMDFAAAGVPEWLAEVPHGRSSSTFALLAGFSIALITGGRLVKTGRVRRQAMVRIAVRALILMVLGTALVAAGATIPLILISYGLFFLLALPFTKLGLRGLVIAAAVVALLGPIARNYGDRLTGGDWADPGYLNITGYELPALLVYGGSLIVLFAVLLERLKWLRVALTPLIAVGGMTLTAYVIQGIALPMLNGNVATTVEDWDEPPEGSLLAPAAGAQTVLWLTVVTTVVAFVWSRFFKRGPLEHLMFSAGKIGRFMK